MVGFSQIALAAGVALAVLVRAHAPQGVGGRDTSGDLVRVESSEEIMGSTFSVVLYGRHRHTLEVAARAALDEAQRLDRMLSNYRPDSEWSKVNRGAPAGPVAVSEELFQLLSECLDYSRRERRGVRHHRGTADEGLGLLQGRRPAAAKG